MCVNDKVNMTSLIVPEFRENRFRRKVWARMMYLKSSTSVIFKSKQDGHEMFVVNLMGILDSNLL